MNDDSVEYEWVLDDVGDDSKSNVELDEIIDCSLPAVVVGPEASAELDEVIDCILPAVVVCPEADVPKQHFEVNSPVSAAVQCRLDQLRSDRTPFGV